MRMSASSRIMKVSVVVFGIDRQRSLTLDPRPLDAFGPAVCCDPMQTQNFIPGKDASLESTINHHQTRLQALGFHIEERSWLNPVDGIWSVHIRDRDCPLMFTNGKGATR